MQELNNIKVKVISGVSFFEVTGAIVEVDIGETVDFIGDRLGYSLDEHF